MARITTKNGDSGMTQLNPTTIASKSHPVIKIQGDLDELSCALGMCGDRFDDVQTFLSEVMGYFYYKSSDDRKVMEQIQNMEEYITTHNNSIPPFFVNPRGAISLARAIARRVERNIVEFYETDRKLSDDEKYGMNMSSVIQYINRLSDYLFVRSFEREIAQPELFKDEMATG